MIGSNEITATAETGYAFSSWGTLPETVAEDLSITATFIATTTTVTLQAVQSGTFEPAPNITLSPSSITLPIGEQYVLSTEDYGNV